MLRIDERDVAGPTFKGGWGEVHGRICVGWLVHVIHGHYVHAEPRSKYFGGGVGGGDARALSAPCGLPARMYFAHPSDHSVTCSITSVPGENCGKNRKKCGKNAA